jgi:hypothetical protein
MMSIGQRLQSSGLKEYRNPFNQSYPSPQSLTQIAQTLNISPAEVEQLSVLGLSWLGFEGLLGHLGWFIRR